MLTKTAHKMPECLLLLEHGTTHTTLLASKLGLALVVNSVKLHLTAFKTLLNSSQIDELRNWCLKG